jgi:hypothetical protein
MVETYQLGKYVNFYFLQYKVPHLFNFFIQFHMDPSYICIHKTLFKIERRRGIEIGVLQFQIFREKVEVGRWHEKRS